MSEPGLGAAARIVMGKPWSLILQDLGLQGHKIIWTKKMLREEIRRFHLGRRSRLRGMTRTRLYQAAQGLYGTWWKALKDAGVRSSQGPRIAWTRGEVIRRIRSRHRLGKSMHGSVVLKEQRSLYATARRVLGKPWEQAIREFGYNDKASKMPWTNEALLREIRNHCMHKKISEGVTPKTLRSAAWRRFGSMEKAKTLALQFR